MNVVKMQKSSDTFYWGQQAPEWKVSVYYKNSAWDWMVSPTDEIPFMYSALIPGKDYGAVEKFDGFNSREEAADNYEKQHDYNVKLEFEGDDDDNS